FFVTGRLLHLDNYAGGAVFNRNAGPDVTFPKSIVYAPDPSLGRAVVFSKWTDESLSLTWQAAPKHKLSFRMQERSVDSVNSFAGTIFGGALISPEAGLHQTRPALWTATADWTSPLSSRVLLEVHLYNERYHGGYGYPAEVNPLMPAVLDQGLGVKYGAFSA